MSGICAAGGSAAARARVEAMLQCMSRFGQRRQCLPLDGETAAGRAWHERSAGGNAAQRGADAVTVLVDGEIFGDTGPLPAPDRQIAELYLGDRLDRVAWLNGSFSAIIIDGRNGRVVLATDRLGSRPLFVWKNGAGFAVASRLEAVLADDRVPRRLSRQGVLELLTLQRTAGGQTQYADVAATQAAEVWTLRAGNRARRQTRRLAWSRPDFDEHEGAERLASALTAAVARRTADDRRHGLLLSGGLDARTVLAAMAGLGRRPVCFTAGPFRNAEVAVAAACARAVGAEHRFLESPPARLAAHLDAATLASDGLFTAPANLFGLLPDMARECDVLLSGHGLDYTFRGYYLPCRMLRLGGSTTRLPRLRPVSDGGPETLARNLRVGISTEAAKAVLRPEVAAEVERRKTEALRRALAAVDVDDPYDAWDAYVLSCLGRHYAWSDFVAMEAVIPHRAVTFDPEVFDIYLAMPPAWRASGRMAQRAMQRLGGALMRLPDANTGVRASLPFPRQIAEVFARAALRRAGIGRRAPLPDPTMSHGSWANYRELLRRDPGFRDRLTALPDDDILMDTNLFDRAGVGRAVTAHLEGRADHAKLLLQLISLASWLAQHGYQSVADDG